MDINSKQLQGALDRVIAVLLTYLLTKHFDMSQLSNLSDDLTIIVVSLLVGGYSLWANRPKALAQAVAALPDTTVITTNDLAKATPENNIVSADEMKVVSK
jgi:hypothetical protein